MATLEQFELEDFALLKLRGSLTTEGLDHVQPAFESATHRPGARVIVDLTAVDLVTTPAISMFIAAAALARQSGGRLIFTQSPPPIQELLHRLRLTNILHTVPGLTEAIKQVHQ